MAPLLCELRGDERLGTVKGVGAEGQDAALLDLEVTKRLDEKVACSRV